MPTSQCWKNHPAWACGFTSWTSRAGIGGVCQISTRTSSWIHLKTPLLPLLYMYATLTLLAATVLLQATLRFHKLACRSAWRLIANRLSLQSARTTCICGLYQLSAEFSQRCKADMVLQGRWMMHGGSYESSPDEFENQLHVFDFNTMLWSKPVLSDQDMGYRTGHMAACHNDHMIIMGGRQRRLGGRQLDIWLFLSYALRCFCAECVAHADKSACSLCCTLQTLLCVCVRACVCVCVSPPCVWSLRRICTLPQQVGCVAI